MAKCSARIECTRHPIWKLLLCFISEPMVNQKQLTIVNRLTRYSLWDLHAYGLCHSYGEKRAMEKRKRLTAKDTSVVRFGEAHVELARSYRCRRWPCTAILRLSAVPKMRTDSVWFATVSEREW